MDILVVDDHPLVTVSLSERLRGMGHRVDVSHTLGDAGAHMLSHFYDMCVLDLDIAGTRGTQLLSDPNLAGRLPECIVILSGTRDRDDIVDALEAGAHAFLSKTVPFDDVIEGLLTAPQAYRGGEPGMWVQEVRALSLIHI